LPEELRARGYEVTATGEGERVVPTAIVERFITGVDGMLVALTEGSTRPVTSTVTRAGIIRVQRFAFDMHDECLLLGEQRTTSAHVEFFAF
jgi:hypothetical protein